MSFAKTISNQSRAVIVLVALLCAAGIFAALQLPIAIFPQTNFPRIVILVDDGEVPATQVLVSVTRPVEEAMNGIPGITRIRSKTERGATEVDLFFNWNIDIMQSLQLVQARLSQLTASLPPSAQIRSVERFTFAVFPIAGYSLVSDTRDPASLRDLASYVIRPRLARLPGIARVTVQGGDAREYHVTVDPARLAARGVSLQQVVDSVRNANLIASPGLIDENHHLELALVSGQAKKPDELNSIVVANVNNSPVSVADVAAVGDGVAPQYIIITADGHRSVLLNVNRQPDANTVTVVNEVTSELGSMQSQLPSDVRIRPFYDQSLLVRSSISSVRDAILIGLVLSVAILFGFLRNWGTTLVAIVVIPVTVLTTLVAMWVAGLSFDLMTLGGIAAAIGLVIDDAIVVVENIYTHIARGEPRKQAITNAVHEITVPIIGSTITPVVVFLPLTLLTGVTGVFFRSLALTMAVALLTSLVLALSFTPVLAQLFVKAPKRVQDDRATESGGPDSELDQSDRHEQAEEELRHGRILRSIIDRYEGLLGRALDHRKIVIVVCAVVVVAGWLLYRGLGSEFLPEFDEGAFVLDYIAPPGTSLEETDRILRHVEQMIQDIPDVESFSRRTGTELGLTVTEPNTGDFLVKLKPDHKKGTDEVTADLRSRITSSEPALKTEFAGILGDLIGDLSSAPEPIEIKLFNEDTTALHQKATEIGQAIKNVDGVEDIKNGVVVSGPAITFKVDPKLAAQLGVTANDVANTVTDAMTGDAASSILLQDRLIPVRVVLPKSSRASLDTVRAIPIRSANSLFRLDQVAAIEYDKGQTEIHREGLRQMVSVTARLDPAKIDLGTAIKKIQATLAKNVKLPPGMTMEYGGLYEQQQSSFRELLLALGLAVALVFVTLLVEFRSFAHPVAILTGAVLALGGVLAALLITKTTLNVVSQLGMIMVIGIVAKNGILMLDTVEDHLKAGDTLRQALLRSGRRRFRPVLMTSLAAMLGMLPLALALGQGAEMLQPLAIGVIGGLMFALLLSLVITPTVYAMLHRKT